MKNRKFKKCRHSTELKCRQSIEELDRIDEENVRERRATTFPNRNYRGKIDPLEEKTT